MTKKDHLSLSTAILININIMLGTGLFINTVILAQFSRALGFLAYAIIGLLMLPLILSMAQLLRFHPGGNFYNFAHKDLSPFAGFISSWAYFTGKLASATLAIYAFCLFAQQIIPQLIQVPILLLNAAVIILFTLLNLLNMRIGTRIQAMFFGLKIIPITFAILSSIFLFNRHHLTGLHLLTWKTIPASLPLALYSFLGFEGAISLSKKIKNPAKNAPKAVLISYTLVIFVACAYQFLFYGALGQFLVQQKDYVAAFPILLKTLFAYNPTWLSTLIDFFYIAIASSALGSAYSIIFSNAWNLFTLANHKHTFFWHRLSAFNRHHIPAACVIIESLICIGYLILTKGNQIPLQQISATGCVIAYAISVLSLLKINHRKGFYSWIAWLALFNCLIFIGACVRNFIVFGITSLLVFIAILAFGTWMFFQTKKNVNQPNAI